MMRAVRASARLGAISLALFAAMAAGLLTATTARAHPVRPADPATPAIPQPSAMVVSGAAARPRAAETARAASEPDGPAPGPSRADAAPGSPATVAVALLASVAALVLGARHRRTLALALVLIAGLLAFEAGVHSVHHLGSARDMSQCAMAAAAAHVQGAIDDPAAALERPGPVSAAPTAPAPQRLATRVWRAGQGRAPPPPALA